MGAMGSVCCAGDEAGVGATAAVLAVTQVRAGDDSGHIVLQWFEMKWKNENEK